MPTTTLSIPGMHCESCSKLIKDVSSDYSDISGVSVDLAQKTVTLEHVADFDIKKWTDDIESLGEAYKIHHI